MRMPWRQYLTRRRAIIGAVLLAYWITWAFGVPALYTSISARLNRSIEMRASRMRSLFEAYQAFSPEVRVLHEQDMLEKLDRISFADPGLSVTCAFPVLPGAIVSCHAEYYAPLSAVGGWFIYLWPFNREIQISGWIS